MPYKIENKKYSYFIGTFPNLGGTPTSIPIWNWCLSAAAELWRS